MARYQLFYLRNGILAGSEEIEAADDVEASHQVKALSSRDAIEIWRDGRRVRTIAPAPQS